MKNKNYRGVWTKEENDLMFRLWPDKNEIARRVGRSVNTVSEHARKNGLKIGFNAKRKWTDEEIERLRELSGYMTRKQIVEKLGIPETNVKWMLRKMDITCKSLAWTDQEIALLKEKFNNTDAEDLEKMFGRNFNAIYEQAHKLGMSRPMGGHVSKASVKAWMRLSDRKSGRQTDLTHIPEIVAFHKVRISLTRELKKINKNARKTTTDV